MTIRVFEGRHRVAVPCGCTLGEAPIWDWRSGTLLWVDIDERRLLRWRPGVDDEPDVHGFDERVSFVKLTPDEDVVVVGLSSGVARYRVSGREPPELMLRPEPHLPGNRLNDAGLAPDGSLFFGSLNLREAEPTGSFYHWGRAGLSRFGEAAVVTNGPTVDGVRGIVYTADTTENRVFRHPIGPDGEPGAREDFVAFRPGDGHPDGITVDAEGYVWICHFGGGRVTRFSPDGRADLIVPIPTPQVTKAAFGGPDLKTVYVTSAARGRDREIDPLAGHVFVVEAEVAGLPAGFWRAPA